MKKKIFLPILFSSVCMFINMTNMREDSFAKSNNKHKIVQAELVEFKLYAAGCGDIVFSYMFKYKTFANATDKIKKREDIYVIDKCIEFHGKGFFKKGAIYTMSVIEIANPQKFISNNSDTESFVHVEYNGGMIYDADFIGLTTFSKDENAGVAY